MHREGVENALRRMGIEPTGFNGQWVQAHCPFAPTRHPRGTDRSPSFGVSTGEGTSVYHCFTCRSKGPLHGLPGALSRETGQDFGDLGALLQVEEAANAVIETAVREIYEEVEPLREEVYGDLFLPLSGEALEYCENRDVDAETAARLGIVYWPEEHRVMFPVRGFGGELYGWTGRAIRDDVKPKVWNLKGMDKRCFLLGAEHCTRERPIVLVEGLFAYAGFHALRVPEAAHVDVLATMGAGVSEEQAMMLSEIGQRVILFFDGDKPGRDATFGKYARDKTLKTPGAVHLLSDMGVPVATVTYPPGINDPDDLDGDEIVKMIRDATPYVRRRRRA